MNLGDLDKKLALPSAEPVRADHTNCAAAQFCVEHYVDNRVVSCRPPPRHTPLVDSHRTCASSDFCVDHYIGAADKPCRASRRDG